jgi:hypothetical protein
MGNKIIGRFYFKQTGNGNLVGEFSNNQSGNIISTESADFIKNIEGSDGDYYGEYNSTWQESGEPIFAKLTIVPKPNCNKLFTLKWFNKNGKLFFEGEGMLCDNILIGDYQSV